MTGSDGMPAPPGFAGAPPVDRIARTCGATIPNCSLSLSPIAKAPSPAINPATAAKAHTRAFSPRGATLTLSAPASTAAPGGTGASSEPDIGKDLQGSAFDRNQS